MKSVELRAKTPSPEDSELWLRNIRAEQGASLSAAFGHTVAKRKLEMCAAFSAGLVVAGIAECLAFVFTKEAIVSAVVLAVLVALSIAATLVYQRAANRAFLHQADFQKRASNAIRIVHEDPEPPAAAPSV